MGRALVLLTALLFVSTGAAWAQQTQNLMVRADLQFLQDKSAGLGLSSVLNIKDENLETAGRIHLSRDPVVLVFSFSGTVVTPTALRLQLTELEKDQATIEILVSDDAPDAGYLSLRTEPLKATDAWQSFTFEPAAARWLMIKIASFNDEVEFDLRELEVTGYEGEPTSLYAFDEAPSEAFGVIKGLEQANLSLDIHPVEKKLFDDAADGSLDSISFAEASLISSGILDESKRTQYLTLLELMTEEARSATADQTSAFDKGRRLLEWLHEGTMKQGYTEAQTDMSAVLDQSHFNCVSSATLYNILARRLGLDARGIEVPDHAFTILYEGTDHVDVETTTARGFDPARNRAALSAFSRTTGYTYISDKHRSKRREINDAGMVALTYYNHGVTATKAEDYPTALLNYFRALSLDPHNKSAIKNTVAVLGKWSKDAIEDNQPRRAIEILDAALSFAPTDRNSRHNMRYALQRAMMDASSEAETTELIGMAQTLHKRTEDPTFLRLQSRVLQNKAYNLAKSGDYEAALQLTQLPDADEATQKVLQRLRSSLFLNWSGETLDTGDFSASMDILERALKDSRPDYRIENNIAFVAQQWGVSVSKSEGPEASQALLLKLSERFPDIRKLQKVAARNYDVDAHAAFKAGDFETAIEIYQTANKLGIQQSQMLRNEKAAWNNWGLSLSDKGNFSGALAVFEQALAAHPSDSKFSNNVAYIMQQWGDVIVSKHGVIEAEGAVAVQRERFKDVTKLKQLQGAFINYAVNAARTPEDFKELAATLAQAGAYTTQQSKYDRLVAYFYQQWAKTAHPQLADDASVAILQFGVDTHPENRATIKMFVYAVNQIGDKAINDGDWPQALSIFQSAGRSLPNERTFIKKIETIREKL